MLEKQTEEFLKNKKFSLMGKRILVGVSGGPDSLSLLHFLWNKQQEKQDFYLVVAHVDHMFRGQESYEEAKFVEAFCTKRQIPFRMRQINVPEYIKRTGKSSQVASRECRYQFFAEVMEEDDLSFLALAHHGDDQIETMLMRITRGSSGLSRSGIPFMRPFENGFIFRPFLCLNREEIEQYCIKYQLNPRHDPSNERDVYLRNRIRKYVVPFLRRENAQVHRNFQRFSDELQQDELLLQELTIQKMNTVWKEKKQDKITIDIDKFLAMPISLQRRGIQLILNYLYPKRPASLSAIHIDSILLLMESDNPSGCLDFPSQLKVIRSYQLCHFLFNSEDIENYYYTLTEPGECVLPNGDIILFQFTNELIKNSKNHILLNKKDVSFPIIIRTKEPGDRMSLKGMEGTKKIKSIFIDQKVPVNERMRWPVITDSTNRILWLPRLKKYHDADTVNMEEEEYILLSYISSIERI